MKLIFMDIDGTLCQEDGLVPKSAQEAVIKTRALGNKVILCTGRSKAEIIPEILNIGFDGVIGGGGVYLELEDTVHYHRTIDAKDVHDVVDTFDEAGIEYYLEANHGLFGSQNLKKAIMDNSLGTMKETDADWFMDLMIPLSDSRYDPALINKIAFIGYDGHMDFVEAQFGKTFQLMKNTVIGFGVNSGELAQKGMNKYTAIQDVLRHYNHNVDDTYAFGDGDNDIDMFRAVKVGVAMENGTEDLKAVATSITSKASDSGIHKAFVQYGLIEEA